MRETRNNCFVSIKRNAALRQRKLDKHECLKTECTFAKFLRFVALVRTYFPMAMGRVTFFGPETVVTSFLHFKVSN